MATAGGPGRRVAGGPRMATFYFAEVYDELGIALVIADVANEFIDRNDDRKRNFGTFIESDS